MDSAHPLHLAQTPAEAQNYVGDNVCARCHAAIAQRHGMSGHAHSLFLAAAAGVGRYFRIRQSIRDSKADTTYHTAVRNGACLLVNDAEGEREGIPASIVIGSGRNGQTYLGRDRFGQWFILRLSYYTHTHGWDFTPGQEPSITSFADPKGQTLSHSQVSECLSCHATSLQMAPNGPDARHSLFGVGCESCHGPGRAHVDFQQGSTVSATRPAASMEDLQTAPPARIMQICGGCHSTLFDSHIDMPKTGESFSRFATTALAQSRCYRSSGTLSCITCHDPHTEVTPNPAAYEAACLGCHSGPARPARPMNASSPPAPICKVNPRNGCIGCHMPTQSNPSFPHTLFHNHYIKIWTAPQAQM